LIIKTEIIENFLLTAGGKITCFRCQAHSKRTKVQCGAPAEKGKKVCRFHGARSTGAKTKEGRFRIVRSKTKHGNETRKVRAERSAKSAELASLEDMMHLTGMTTAPRTRGRKPANYEPITSLDAAFDFMAKHSITP
jgi:hypothetical protein